MLHRNCKVSMYTQQTLPVIPNEVLRDWSIENVSECDWSIENGSEYDWLRGVNSGRRDNAARSNTANEKRDPHSIQLQFCNI